MTIIFAMIIKFIDAMARISLTLETTRSFFHFYFFDRFFEQNSRPSRFCGSLVLSFHSTGCLISLLEILGSLSIKPNHLKQLIGLFKNNEENGQVGRK